MNYNTKELDGEFGDFYCEEFEINRINEFTGKEELGIFTRCVDKNVIFWKLGLYIYIYPSRDTFDDLEKTYADYKQNLREKKLKIILNGKLYTGEI